MTRAQDQNEDCARAINDNATTMIDNNASLVKLKHCNVLYVLFDVQGSGRGGFFRR